MHLLIVFIALVMIEVTLHYHIQLTNQFLQYLPVLLKYLTEAGNVLTKFLSGG